MAAIARLVRIVTKPENRDALANAKNRKDVLALLKKAERGILICGSGVGTCVAANKFPGIRAAICHDSFSAHQGVEDDNINVLCLGARVIGSELAKDIVRIWLAAEFSGAERHVRRLEKVEQIENEFIRKS